MSSSPSEPIALSSSRPYLIRAIHQWILDNNCTPYAYVNATLSGVTVPTQYIENGKITLNLSPRATYGLTLGNDLVSFAGRFAGVSLNVQFPPAAVLAIYAKENGQGMIFDKDDSGGGPPPPSSGDKKPAKPTLRVVK